MKNLLLILIGAAVLSGCDGNPVDSEGNIKKTPLGNEQIAYNDGLSNILVPLAIGNYWKYKAVYKGMNTNYTPEYFKQEVMKDTIIDNNRWFMVSSDSKFTVEFLGNLLDGFYMLSAGPGTSFGQLQKELKYKYPVNLNDSFDALENGITYTRKLLSKTKQVTIDLGSFSAYHYQDITIDISNSGYFVVNHYVVPGLGILKLDLAQYDYSGRIVWSTTQQLVEYRLK